LVWALHCELLHLKELEDCLKIHTTSSQFPRNDLENVINSGTIAKCDDFIFITAKIFKVPKSDGKYSRMVWDGRNFDDVIKLHFKNKRESDAFNNQLQHESEYDIPATPLPNLPKLVNETLNPKWNFISTVDAKNMFYQFSAR
jgi:hypothetical protein